MNCFNRIIFIVASLFLSGILFAKDPVRIKDIAVIQGVKENQLSGIGLVTGLQGSGDSSSFKMTQKMVLNLASNYGFNITEDDIKGKNVACVMVTARVGGFVRIGDSVDVMVSSLGDAKSLEGGVLLMTAMRGANDKVYVVAQGRIIAGKKSEKSETVATIPGGGIVEDNIVSSFVDNGKVRIMINNPDFTTATMIKTALTDFSPDIKVTTLDAGLVEIVPDAVNANDIVNFISQIELLTVTPDFTATVIIDKKTGVIVSGGDIIIQECSVTTPKIQVTVGQQSKNKNEKKQSVVLKSTSVAELVSVLNQASFETQEIISILEAINRSGALNAKIIVM